MAGSVLINDKGHEVLKVPFVLLCPLWLALLPISLNSCHDLDVKILTLPAVPMALGSSALAGHETLRGEASR
jgi:hypothetical protein